MKTAILKDLQARSVGQKDFVVLVESANVFVDENFALREACENRFLPITTGLMTLPSNI